tara:strand:- start:1578 stop:2234 length:657 start_codon:yes stop_codon:yes gene_type:complete
MSNQIIINKNIIKYLQKIGYKSDLVLEKIIEETYALGTISKMQIAPEQGQFLQIIVKIINASKCLEIGRFTGLSTLHLARGLPEDGKVITIDNSEEYLAMAKQFWKLDKIDHKIDTITGAGVDVMQSFIDRQFLFDLIFIDADKNNYLNYYELALNLIPKNGIILIDNMLWHGDVADKDINDKTTLTIRNLNSKVQNDNRVDFSLIPLADGILLIRKK